MEGSADPLTDVVRARERTLAAGSARIQLVSELIFRSSPRDQMASAFSRLTWRTAKAVGRMLMRTVFRKLDFRRMTAEGVIDMPGRRYRLAQGHYAWLYAEGKLWPGWSRRAIATLEPWEEDEPRPPEPLWLLDLLAGVTDATEIGTEVVRGTPCRHLRVVVDASRASQAIPGGVPVPARPSFEELLALPMEVWIDDSRLRRVYFRRDRHGAETMELWDFGLTIDEQDWPQLPTFQTPDD
ncbi:MAG: hypothetical protein ACRDGH_17115 [Candidatus Limnocylindria bacterium]